MAERYLVIRDLLASSPDAIHPVTREITIAGSRLSAADTFAALYRLQGLRKTAERAFAGIDALVLPTAPTVYSTSQALANPVELNSRLGTYTNFVNLLDLCGLALPAALASDDTPFGITLLAPAGQDAQLASIGRVFHADTKLPIGANKLPQPPLAALPAACAAARSRLRWSAHIFRHGAERRIEGARRPFAGGRQDGCGLQALCAENHAAEARHAARGGGNGLVDRARSLGAAGGRLATFVDAVPPPLSIGTVRLADGRGVKGFIVEAADVAAPARFPASAAGARSSRRPRRIIAENIIIRPSFRRARSASPE